MGESKRIGIRLEKPLASWVEEQAELEGTNVSQFIRDVLKAERAHRERVPGITEHLARIEHLLEQTVDRSAPEGQP